MNGYNDLYHYGVKGMKWGVRRYQNPDGTLTEAGRARYGSSTDHSKPTDKSMGDASIPRMVGKLNLRDYAGRANEKRLNRKIEEAKKNKQNTEALEKAREAQSAANANIKAYTKYTSTGKLIAQTMLLGVLGSANYRAARARGAGRFRSLIESNAGVLPIGTILAAQGNKKAYGKRLVLSDFENDDTGYIL